MLTVPDRAFSYFPRATVAEPKTVQNYLRLPWDSSGNAERLMPCGPPVPIGLRAVLEYPAVGLEACRLLGMSDDMRLGSLEAGEDRQGD